MVLDFVLETLATITGVVSSFAMLPQIYRIFRRKSAKGISIWTYLYMLVAGGVGFEPTALSFPEGKEPALRTVFCSFIV